MNKAKKDQPKKTVRRKPATVQAAPKDPEIITHVAEEAPVEPAPKKEERRRRTKLGGLRLKMSVPENLRRPGHTLQWWHEEDLLEAQDGGYTFIKKDEDHEIGESQGLTQRQGVDSRISLVVGRREDGSPIRDYLMEIPDEWAKEDREAVQQASQEVIDGMKRGEDAGGRAGVDQRYIPKEGIKIGSSTR